MTGSELVAKALSTLVEKNKNENISDPNFVYPEELAEEQINEMTNIELLELIGDVLEDAEKGQLSTEAKEVQRQASDNFIRSKLENNQSS